MASKEFGENISPFFAVKHEDSYYICLYAGEYKNEIFEQRADEGFEGSGDDWGSLALVFLEEKMPELKEVINFDPESGMFCIYSEDKKALQKFTIAFKEACENDTLIQDLFSRAELD